MTIDRGKLGILALAIGSTSLTWILNHHLGLGPIVANGLIGVLAAILMPGALAGVAYTSSFVGMSSLAVLPSIMFALIGGLIAGFVIIATTEIYAGIGGKGGTTAAAAALVTRAISGLLG
jgi:hypothetical protein